MELDGGEEREARRRRRGRRPRFTAGDTICARQYYYTGERFVPPGEKKLGIFRKALRCYQEGLKRRHGNIEFVEVPYEGKRCRRTS